MGRIGRGDAAGGAPAAASPWLARQTRRGGAGRRPAAQPHATPASTGSCRPAAPACSRSRFQVPLRKAQASAGRDTCGVVRTLTPWPVPSCEAWLASALAEVSGSISSWRFGHGPCCMACCSGFSAVASACGGRSPTKTTPRRLCASSASASAWRAAVSASISVV